MSNPVVQASVREKIGKQLNKVRNANQLPAVLYGGKAENISLAVEAKPFGELFRKTGTSSLIDLVVAEKKPVQVLVHEVQRDPVSDEIIHVDFFQVDMSKKIVADVHLTLVGESKAVKELGGVLIKGVDKVKVEALPHDLVQHIDVDITSMVAFDDIIRVSDLQLPSGLVVKEGADGVVANVKAPRTQEEIEALEEKAEETVGDVEKVGEEAAAEGEEEAGAEGDAAKKEGDTPAAPEEKKK